MLVAWMSLAAVASDGAEPSEEIVVWGDRFARWERRWLVETELHFAEPMRVLGWVNTEMDVTSLQVRAVLSCDKDFELGPRSWEVHCDIEDIGLVAVPRRVSSTDQGLLEELDGTLTEAAIQLQVSDGGGVPDVDLEDVAAHDLRTRTRLEVLRQLVSRVVLPFHLTLPETVTDGARWYEYDSRLLSMPSGSASAGASTVAHYLDGVSDELFVVQSIGKATLRPAGSVDVLEVDENGDIVGMHGGAVDIYEVDLHGVAVIERSTGIMSERVWSVDGGLTPSSPNVLSATRYHHSGRIRMLGEADRPDVGQTRVAARPDRPYPGRATWIPFQP